MSEKNKTIWLLSNLMVKYIEACTRTNYQESDTEEQQRYSLSIYYWRERKEDN